MARPPSFRLIFCRQIVRHDQVRVATYNTHTVHYRVHQRTVRPSSSTDTPPTYARPPSCAHPRAWPMCVGVCNSLVLRSRDAEYVLWSRHTLVGVCSRDSITRWFRRTLVAAYTHRLHKITESREHARIDYATTELYKFELHTKTHKINTAHRRPSCGLPH